MAVQQGKFRRRRRNIVELMRGDIIRFVAQSQLNSKVFFIDYIDESRMRLLPDMRSDESQQQQQQQPQQAAIDLALDAGRFPSEAQIESVELLYRNEKEPGYARQRGLLPGKWIEIEYITEKDGVTLMVYGEIKTLAEDTDCIGVSVYTGNETGESASESEPGSSSNPFIYIDFEFKGLSDELYIKSIKVCNKPRSLLHAQQQEKAGREQQQQQQQQQEQQQEQQQQQQAEEEEYQEQDQEEARKKVNLEFQTSPPGPPDNSAEQTSLIDAGDKVAIMFGPIADDENSPVIFTEEVSRYYSLDEQCGALLDALIDMEPVSRSHHLASNKEYIRMIERYTQLREAFSVKNEYGHLVRREYYGDAYRPMVDVLTDIPSAALEGEFSNDWLMPIYVQKRVLHSASEKEAIHFEDNDDAAVFDMDERLTADQSEYEQYYAGKSTFATYMNNLRVNSTPFVCRDELRYVQVPYSNTRLQSNATAFTSISTGYADPESLVVPAMNASKTRGSFLSTERYIPGDDVPVNPVGYMIRPYPFVAYSELKGSASSIMDKANARLVMETSDPLGTSCYHWWSLAAAADSQSSSSALVFNRNRIDSRRRMDLAQAKPYRDRFANTIRSELYFTQKRADAFGAVAVSNMAPTTEELAEKVTTYFGNYYYTALSPHVLIKSLRPFFVQPEHITHGIFSVLSKFITDNLSAFKSTIKLMKRKYTAYESFDYPGFGTGAGPFLNSLYAMVTRPDVVRGAHVAAAKKRKADTGDDAIPDTSIFDTTVLSRYPLKEWMVRGKEKRHSRILSTTEVLGRMYSSDFGRCFVNEIIQMNMMGGGSSGSAEEGLYGVNVSGVISHFVAEAQKFTDVNQAVKDVKSGTAKGKFLLAKRYESMEDLNADNDNSPHVPIAYDAEFDSTDYEFIRKYEKERRTMPDDVFKAFLIDKMGKKHPKMNPIECAFEVDSMVARRRAARIGKDRAVVEFQTEAPPNLDQAGDDAVMISDAAASNAGEGPTTGYRYYKLHGSGTWVLDDTIPETVTPENMAYFGNITPGAIVVKNNCLSPETGVTSESSAVVTSMAKAELISKITHEFDGAVDTKYDEFKDILARKIEYSNYRLVSEMFISRKKQMEVNTRHYKMGLAARLNRATGLGAATSNLAVSPHRDILDSYLGNGSFPRMQELLISFARTYTRKANRPCVGTLDPDDASADKLPSPPSSSYNDVSESCEWLYCKDSGTRLMPAWMLDKANAYVNDGVGEQSYVNVMDRICREYGIVEGAVWVDGKRCQSGYVIMPVAFSTYEGIDEQGFKIKTHSAISMDADDDILGLPSHRDRGAAAGNGASPSGEVTPAMEHAYMQRLNDKFKNTNAHKINDVVTPVLKMGLGIAPDRDGLRDYIITSVIHSISNLGEHLIMSKEKYEKRVAASTAEKKKGKPPPYDFYHDRRIVMVTLAHIIVVLQSAIPDIRPSKTFRTCKTTFRGFPVDGDGGDQCLVYVACIANGVKDASKDVWASVIRGVSVESYVEDIKSSIKTILEKETDAFLKTMLDVKNRQRMQDEATLRAVVETGGLRSGPVRVKKWTQFLPLLYSLQDIRTPEPVSEHAITEFIRQMKEGRHAQHERMDLLRSKLMQYSMFIQKMIQEWIQSGGSKSLSLILFSNDHRPVTENACCDDMMLSKRGESAGANGATRGVATVLDYFVENANANIREYNGQIERLGNILSDVFNISKAAILSVDGLEFARVQPRAPGELTHEYSDETIYKGFIHFCKLDQPNAMVSSDIEKMRGPVPADYDPKDELADKIKKLKSGSGHGTTYDSESFKELLDVVTRESKLQSPSTMQVIHADELVYSPLKSVLIVNEPVNEVTGEPVVMNTALRTALYALIEKSDALNRDDYETAAMTELNAESEKLRTMIRRFIQPGASDSSGSSTANEDVLRFIELLTRDAGETELGQPQENKRTLHYTKSDDNASTIRFVTFIKNAIRFMLQTVPGLLITSEAGNDATRYVSSKHWKFGVSHNVDISRCIDSQYANISKFRDDAEIKRLMQQVDTGSVYKTTGYVISQFANSIPVACDSRNRLSGNLVRELYAYLFYKTVELYMGRGEEVATTAMLSPGIALGGDDAMDASRIVNMDRFSDGYGYSGDELVMMAHSRPASLASTASREKHRALMVAVVQNVIRMQSTNAVTFSRVKKVMAGIRRRETEEMRHSFYTSSENNDRFRIKSEMLKLRLGEFSVGAQAGYRTYDRNFDEQERDARNARMAEGREDPAVSFDAYEQECTMQMQSDVVVDGQQAISPMDGDDYERDQSMRNEIEIISAC
jgi:hypothetical protein